MAYHVFHGHHLGRSQERRESRKHGVSFEEAQELLLSHGGHLVIFDDEHSIEEDRFLSIGPIRRGLVLVVWTERDAELNSTLRVISPRWATRSERRLFYSYIGGLP